MVIKTLDVENPFADYGNIVQGHRFIGRQLAINAIYNRVLGNNYGNLAIMGLPRIGKSSLAWNALMVNKAELVQEKILVERVNVGSINSPKSFYLKLMDKVLPSIKTLSFELYNQLTEARNIYVATENENEIEFFFALVKQFQYRLIYILDEFDNIVNFFKLEDFQLLRELSISPETKICLVSISRRSIQELEPDNGAISNFYGVFSDLHLQLFNDDDIKLYWQRILNLGIEISEDYANHISFLVGNHPYWLDMVNYYIFNNAKLYKKNGIGFLSEIGTDLKKTLWNNYDDIILLMDKEGLKNHFIQAVVGPAVNITQMSIERLLKYGLIRTVAAKEKYGDYFQKLVDSGFHNEDDISYNSISLHFNEYLKQNEVEFAIWPLWNEAENNVRSLINIYLKEKYTDNWRDNFLSKHPKQEKNIQKMELMRADNKKRFGSLASNDLIRYTYPLEMWDTFINSDWHWFQIIFNNNTKQDWQNKFLLLAKIRNPIAHSNKDFVSQDALTKAKEICSEILQKINSWKDSY